MFARPVIFALTLATFAFAQPRLARSQPTTAPVDPQSLHALVFALGNRDPAIREQARDKLMQLTRDDLPLLAEAARGRPLLPTQRSLLHDVVVHVYLTGNHNFTGSGAGYLGIMAVPTASYIDEGQVADAQPADGQPPPDENAEPPIPPTRRGAVVQSRTPGCDAYRVLEIGDVITAVSRPGSGDGTDQTFSRITGFSQLRPLLDSTQTGEWIVLRILRNGAQHDVRLRLARRPPMDQNGNMMNEVPEGEDYWKKTFEHALTEPPASRPTTQSAQRRKQGPNPARTAPTDVPKP